MEIKALSESVTWQSLYSPSYFNYRSWHIEAKVIKIQFVLHASVGLLMWT